MMDPAPDLTKTAQDMPGAHRHSQEQSLKCPQAGKPSFPSHCADAAPAPGSSTSGDIKAQVSLYQTLRRDFTAQGGAGHRQEMQPRERWSS